MELASWDGTISSAEFFRAARVLTEQWKLINPTYPPWTWIPCLGAPRITPNQGYLSLEHLCLLQSSQEDVMTDSCDGEEESVCSEEEDSTDRAVLVQTCAQELHYYDFHIVYSATYRVPVLYFRVYQSDGNPLVLEDIVKGLPTTSTKIMLESKWTFITAEEHPHLNRPWFKLHPCGTSEWMKLLYVGGAAASDRAAMEQYLVSWISVVGQVFGLSIPSSVLKTFNHHHKQNQYED